MKNKPDELNLHDKIISNYIEQSKNGNQLERPKDIYGISRHKNLLFEESSSY